MSIILLAAYKLKTVAEFDDVTSFKWNYALSEKIDNNLQNNLQNTYAIFVIFLFIYLVS